VNSSSTNSSPSPFLLAEQLTKSFAQTPVLRGVDLTIHTGEIVCLLGPSGCGKTTLLRVIAGLEMPDTGRVVCEGVDITSVPAHRREFGLMFQDYALFPHMSVFDNIAFGLRMHHWPRPQIEQRIQELLDLVNLSGYAERKVHELSGGEQQRVALARSLAPQPRLLMLDEPMGSLDRVLRDRLLDELREVLGRLQQTALYVTHDQWEAFAVADRIVLMNEGVVEQGGTPDELYRQPASLFAARFLGFRNEFPARVLAVTPNPILETPLGKLYPLRIPEGTRPGEKVVVVVRPEVAQVHSHEISAPNLVSLRFASLSFRGAQCLWRLRPPQHPNILLEFHLPPQSFRPHPGDMISLTLQPDGILVFAGSPTEDAGGKRVRKDTPEGR